MRGNIFTFMLVTGIIKNGSLIHVSLFSVHRRELLVLSIFSTKISAAISERRKGSPPESRYDK